MSDYQDDENEYSPISARMVMRLLGWLKPYRGLYILGAVSGVVSIALELASPEFLRLITDEAIPGHSPDRIIHLAVVWGVVMLCSLLFDMIQIGATRRCGENVINDIRLAIFNQLQ